MLALSESDIEGRRDMRRGGMTVRDIAPRSGFSTHTIQKYTTSVFDRRLGHTYKAPVFERHTVARTLANGTKRSVTADTKEQAEKVCNWELIGDVAAKIVAKTAINRLGPKAEHSTNRAARNSATNTETGLTETAYSKEASNGC